MTTDTETLLAESLEALVADQPFTPDLSGIEGRGQHLRHRATTLRALTGAGVVVGLAAVLARGVWMTPPAAPGSSAANAGSAVLYRLASAASAVPPLQGRYTVRSETDTDSRVVGETQRTEVIDTQTGASTIYQHATTNAQGGGTVHLGDTGAPTVHTEGPDPTLAEGWFAALSTDPDTLRGQLLSIGKQPAAPPEASTPGIAPAEKSGPGAAQPALGDDDVVYEEANGLLWDPLVPPALRSALYQVLAQTSGVTVNPNATDPAGRPAIAMSRTGSEVGVEAGQLVHNLPGNPATGTTYEDPSTGAVLAQVWQVGRDTLTAVYQPATGSPTIPPDPYPAG